MKWRINKLELTNFKFFKDTFPLEVGGKHVLLYGENGSGKSSIYWGLYTFFQARLKNANDYGKYFDSTHDENLLNKYAQLDEESKISVQFKDMDADPPNVCDYYVGGGGDNLHNADLFLERSVASSDFFNYKFISALSDFRNSQKVELFDLFRREVFPLINFRRAYQEIDTRNNGFLTASSWWNYCNEAIRVLPHQSSKPNQLDSTSPLYQAYTDLLDDFYTELRYFLDDIEQRANQMLHTTLKMPNASIVFTLSPILFNELKIGAVRARDGILRQPELILEIVVNDANMTGATARISHLKSFFNEAKLTCICLAIRMAIENYKLIVANDVVSLLCIDDLLISLDMSRREPVIDLLFNQADDVQMMVFTHDRALFNIMKREIHRRGKEVEWTSFELFEMDHDMSGHDYPEPYLKSSGTYVDAAKAQIQRGDYPAAANYLRKFAEEQIKMILPENLTLSYDKSEKNYQKLLTPLYTTLKTEFCNLYDFPSVLIPDIEPYRDRLMNPLSHDDGHTPIFKSELLNCINLLNGFVPIVSWRRMILDKSHLGSMTYRMSMTNDGLTIIIEFAPTEQWDYFDVPGHGRKYKNCFVKVSYSSHIDQVPMNKELRVKELWRIVYRAVRLNAMTCPPIDQCVTETGMGGRLLSAI